MATTTDRTAYDTSIGTNDRSVVAVTKFWGVVLAAVAIIGVLLIGYFIFAGSSRSSGGISSENTATRPAEP